MKNKIINFIKKKNDLIGYIVLALFFIYVQVKICNNLDASIEADMSSELVLAKMLAQQKKIITTDWFYSTELKVLHNTLIFAPLFLISDNWRFIRMASIVILNVILFLSYLYLAKKLKLKHIPWIALLVLGATSRDYYKFVLLGTHYIPDIAVSFITVGLLISIFEYEKKKNIKLILLLVLSFLSSLSGIRFVSALHIPLLLSSIIYCIYCQNENIKLPKLDIKDNSFKLFIICLLCFVSSFAGVVVNKFVLPSLGYSYRLDEVVISYLDLSFENIATVINGWLLNFGYQSDNLQAFSISQLIIKPLFVVFFCLMCYSTFDILKNRKKYNKYEIFVTLYFVVAIVILSLVFIFTSAWYRNRYLLTISIFEVFIIGIFLKHYEIEWFKWVLIICISLFSISNTVFQIKYHVENDGYGEFVEIKDILLENNCYNGYCDWHWNGHNLLTELSDGQIETWVFYKDINNLNEWLQAKIHTIEKPSGKTFLIISKDIFDYEIKIEALDYIYWEDDKKILFIFNNIKQIQDYVIGLGYKINE